MSEFGKELDAKIKSGEIMEEIYKNGCIVSYFVSFKDILSTFKDWQPPKPLVVVPQFVADWFEYQLKNNNDLDKFDGNDIFRIIQDVIKVSNDESTWEDYGITDEIVKFAEDNEELFLNLIVNCSLGYGYTVEKEKLYYLKHIEMSKHNDVDYWFSKKEYEHASTQKGVLPINFGWLMGYGIGYLQFTQSEIDDMKVGSYEQIEVKVEEVEK